MPRESLRGHVRPHRYRSREAIPPVPPEVLQDPSPMLGPAAKLWVSQLVQPQSLTSCAVRLLPQAAKQRTGRSLLTYHVETCFRDCSATRTDGTLQADVISTSCTLTSDLYPASPRAHSTARCAAGWWPLFDEYERAKRRQTGRSYRSDCADAYKHMGCAGRCANARCTRALMSGTV